MLIVLTVGRLFAQTSSTPTSEYKMVSLNGVSRRLDSKQLTIWQVYQDCATPHSAEETNGQGERLHCVVNGTLAGQYQGSPCAGAQTALLEIVH